MAKARGDFADILLKKKQIGPDQLADRAEPPQRQRHLHLARAQGRPPLGRLIRRDWSSKRASANSRIVT